MINRTRNFTEAEEAVLVTALCSFRRTATDDERSTIDGIIRDGWNEAPRLTANDVTPAQLALVAKPAEVNNMAPAVAEQANAEMDAFDRARLLGERIGTLCGTLTGKHAQQNPNSTATVTYFLDTTQRAGTRFLRIVMSRNVSDRSVHAFVDTTTGDVIKAAGWKAPAKRKSGLATVGSLLVDADYERIIETCDPYGSYLYAR